jgi:hypothetical protein
VAEQTLNFGEFGSSLEQMTGERVPQAVRVNLEIVFGYKQGPTFDPSAKRANILGKGTSAGLGCCRSQLSKETKCFGSQGYNASLPALAEDLKTLLSAAQFGPFDVVSLGNTQSRSIEELEEQLLADLIAFDESPADGEKAVFIDDLHQCFWHAGSLEVTREVLFQVLTALEELQKSAKGADFLGLARSAQCARALSNVVTQEASINQGVDGSRARTIKSRELNKQSCVKEIRPRGVRASVTLEGNLVGPARQKIFKFGTQTLRTQLGRC